MIPPKPCLHRHSCLSFKLRRTLEKFSVRNDILVDDLQFVFSWLTKPRPLVRFKSFELQSVDRGSRPLGLHNGKTAVTVLDAHRSSGPKLKIRAMTIGGTVAQVPPVIWGTRVRSRVDLASHKRRQPSSRIAKQPFTKYGSKNG